MSISSEISRLSQNISDSLTAVANKGVTVPAGSNSDDLPGLIAQISSGGAFSVVDTTDSHGGIIRTITGGIQISGTKSITENGTGIDVSTYAAVDVAVPTGADCPTFTVTTNSSWVIQTVTCDKTYDECIGYLQNDVWEAIVVLTNGTDTTSYGATYVGDPNATLLYAMTGAGDVVNLIVSIDSSSNANGTMNPIPYRDSTDLSASGATVIVPSGYYESQATKIVASGTTGTPTATKGTVSNHSVSVTPSVTNTTGYITGGTKTGTAISVTASELASGNKEITANGTNIDVVGYSTVSVAVPTGSSKNIQYATGQYEISSQTYVATDLSITVSKAGTYKCYWTMYRNTTSGTTGTQLYKGNTALGSAHSSWTFNGNARYAMACEETLTFSANDTIKVWARSRNTSYICGVMDFFIVEQ